MTITEIMERSLKLDLSIYELYLIECVFYRDNEKVLEVLTKKLSVNETRNQFKLFLTHLTLTGWLIKIDTDTTLHSYELTDKANALFVDKRTAGDQLWEIYPSTYYDQGKNYPLGLMDKEIFYTVYWEAIKGDANEHKRVIEDLKYAIKEGFITFKIEKFVRAQVWTQVRKLREAGEGSSTDNDQFNLKDF